MSSPIWTPDALSSNHRRYAGACWRLVEAQHRVSTLKLVDDLEEQSLLEDILEESKPNIPIECQHLHYLFATPFRYGAPYPHGSRFRRAGRTLGVYYAAEAVETAVAEIAFYRLLFYAESPDTNPPDSVSDHTAISAAIETERAIDLTLDPLAQDRAKWVHPYDYQATQALADVARAAETDLIRTESVRDPSGAANIAILACRAFAKPNPVESQTWRIRVGHDSVQALCQFPEKRLEFYRRQFDDPRLP